MKLRLSSFGNRKALLALAVLVLTPMSSYADDLNTDASSTKAKLPENPALLNKVKDAEAVDEMITNANLRAYSGSLSKWSLASTFNYDGGTLKTPLAESRPNIAAASATTPETDINGQLNLKYNMNATNSILLGFGIRKIAPFVTQGPSSAYYATGGKDMDMFDPSLTYQKIYRLGVVQAVAQVYFIQYTRADIISTQGNGGNLDKNLGFDQENIIELGQSGVSVGGSIGFAGNSPKDSSIDYSHYQYWADPYLEYKINDTINFRTVTTLWSYEIYPTEGVVHDTVTQSVGLGFSVTRDIFLYPNVQFVPENAVADNTNVGLTATINLF